MLHYQLIISIEQEIMESMYHFNHRPENSTIKDYAPGKRAEKDFDNWGGARTRSLLGAAYTLAFTCLLRFDEVLKLRLEHITLINEKIIRLTLPFRKTHQFGGESNG